MMAEKQARLNTFSEQNYQQNTQNLQNNSGPSELVSESRQQEGSIAQPAGANPPQENNDDPGRQNSGEQNAANGEANKDAPNQPDLIKAPSEQPVAPVNGASIFANPALSVSQIALSPTPRKSERERKHVSYDKLNTHGQHNSDEDSVLGDGYPGTHTGTGH